MSKIKRLSKVFHLSLGQSLRLRFLLISSLFEVCPAWGAAFESYRIESIQVIGSQRIDAEQLQSEFGLAKDQMINDASMLDIREKILSLSLFRSVLLSIKKGSRRGYVHLKVEIEDDPSLIGPWALAGEVGFVYHEQQVIGVGAAGPPLGYRFKLLGRNWFGQFHRGSLGAEIDNSGLMRNFHLVYGWPRYALEDVQFDTDIRTVDVSQRYLDAMGFGMRLGALWSRAIGDYDEIHGGTAMYVNRAHRYSLPGFPTAVGGAKIGYVRETRFQGFLPSAGHRLAAAFIYAPFNAHLSITEFSLAKTWQSSRYSWLTTQADLMAVGLRGHSARAEARLDWSLQNLGWASGVHDSIYLRARGGQDYMSDHYYYGMAAIIGLRTYSFGMIADISFQFTRSPFALGFEELVPLPSFWREQR